MLDRLSYEYIAGILDGEGNICITPRTDRRPGNYQLRVKIEMTDEATIRSIHKTVGRGSVFTRKLKSGKQSWRWDLATRDSLAFLIDIVPHLVLKKTLAEIAIKYQSSIISNRGNKKITKQEARFRDDCYKEFKKEITK